MAEWHPDFCPTQPGCILITNNDQSAFVSFVSACVYHQQRRVALANDNAVFTDIRACTSIKERMREAMAREYGLTKETDPGVFVPSASLVPVVPWPYVAMLHLVDPVAFPLPPEPWILCEPNGDFSAVTGLSAGALDAMFFAIEQEIIADPFASLVPLARHRAYTTITTAELAARTGP